MELNKRYEDFYKAREIIKDILSKDLMGPVLENENIIELPMQYYALGKLYPKNQETEILDMSRAAGVDSETDTYDTSLASTNMRNPSSMGITCTLKPNVECIRINIEFGTYVPNNAKEVAEKEINIKRWEKDSNEDTVYWVRKAHSFEADINICNQFEKEILNGIIVKGYVHKICKDGEIIFTVVLINNRECSNDVLAINSNMIFQPHIRISSANKEDRKIFISTSRQVEISNEKELHELDMLYSKYKCYGQGHGCSVNWINNINPETEEPDFVESTFIPEYNLKQMKAVQLDQMPVLIMKYIFTAQSSDVIKSLYEFAKLYKEWIEQKGYEIGLLEERYKECAHKNIDNCNRTYLRIINSIKILDESSNGDKVAWLAFKHSNEAMYMQRKQALVKSKNMGNDNDIKWYPFQLAFFLQELTSIINPESNERKLVDLLWFPTGGGKTEAYLGIAAFTIFYRRMKYKEAGEGVSVIMRYTLRLLTIQQFERASLLICACELLRKKHLISDKPIEIGLWVGNELTPKNVEKAENSLRKLKVGAKLSADEADPCQVKICPWCGAELTAQNYSTDKSKGKMNIKCNNIECDFSGISYLPVRLLDQEIYTFTPAFLLATVDKFAQITLNSEPTAIFGVDSVHHSPDLIIQDELHLISGPLGTMTGIYEAAITKICEKNNYPIKIVASTATIRNADNQIKALYGREHTQFPPQGLTVDDSFFAARSNEHERPARLYLGYMGVGTTFTTTLIRVYAAWLFASRYLVTLGYSDKVIDNFWTMTGYFNSLRELGGTSTQVVDDVQSRYQHLKDRKFAHLIPKFIGKDNYEFSEELTSRMGNDRISEIIQKGLKKPFTRLNSEDVYDFILASNMISVGVDVGRLGTMAVAGQPKTNAEYIQATSRVGRDNPGIVFTIYNPSRSRDRSHYEQFLRYHSAMYRYVEATSLTPFSDRARDRGLQALFVTLCRYLISDLRANHSAGKFNKNSEEISEIEKMITEYVREVDEKEIDNVLAELYEIEEIWQEQTGGELFYRMKGKKNLLKPDTDEKDRFRTMNSMRSVEQQSGIYLLGV